MVLLGIYPTVQLSDQDFVIVLLSLALCFTLVVVSGCFSTMEHLCVK